MNAVIVSYTVEFLESYLAWCSSWASHTLSGYGVGDSKGNVGYSMLLPSIYTTYQEAENYTLQSIKESWPDIVPKRVFRLHLVRDKGEWPEYSFYAPRYKVAVIPYD